MLGQVKEILKAIWNYDYAELYKFAKWVNEILAHYGIEDDIMIEYKAVYIRPDSTCYSITFLGDGTRYEILKQAEELKINKDDSIVYVRSMSPYYEVYC